MPSRVKIVYEKDDSCGHLPHNPDQGAEGGSLVRTGVADSFLKQLACFRTKKEYQRETVNGRVELKMDALKSTRAKSRRQVITDSMASKKFEVMRDQCLKKKILFEDPEFPATQASIGKVTGLDLNKIEWLRPKEIDPNADYIQDNIDRFDIQQGQLGNCWLLAVISSITNYESLLHHVIPQNQSMKTEDYAGIFRFRFWQFGIWKEVIVDDRIPVFKGTKKLVFMHSSDAGEFWSPLVEKAYAKLNGSYANLEGGVQAEAMEDFTGGMCQTIDLKQPPEDLLESMIFNSGFCTMMGVSSISQTGEDKQATGLVKGHAYSITGVDYVMYKGQKKYLIRCRNPWGNSVEWKGAFADHAKEWDSVSAEDKKRINLTFAGDGEFWMTFEDFLANWTTLEICHLGSMSLAKDDDVKSKKKYEETIFTGEWVRNVSAGGCANNQDTYAMNPQFKIVVPKESSGQVSIGLMQKDSRAARGGAYLSIGYMLYRLSSSNTGLLTREFFRTTKHIGMSKFAGSREIVTRFKLEPGEYAIVPSTFQKNEECSFILRVMTEVELENEEIDNMTRVVGLSDDLLKEMYAKTHSHKDDEKVKAHFDRLKDYEGNINSKQLVEILNASKLKGVKNFQGFTGEMGRALLALVDDDISGRLNFKEFEKLWEDCELWKFIYEKVDSDNSGFLEPMELREAIRMSGFNVCNSVFGAIIHRYTEPDTGYVDFDDFIICLSRLKNSVENMTCQTKTTTGHRLFSEEEFMQCSIYT